jgi:hypothetical protein
VFVTRYEYWMASPACAAPWSDDGSTMPVLATLTDGEGAAVSIVTVEGSLGGLVPSRVSVPVAVAVSTILPLSMSDWATT